MEKVEIPNTYYRELTEERKETKIKQIVPDKEVRVLLNEKIGIFKMGQLVDVDIDSYRNLLMENKIAPKVSLYSIHFEGYLLKGEYKDLEISLKTLSKNSHYRHLQNYFVIS